MKNELSMVVYHAVWKDITESPPPPLPREEAEVARERHFDLLQAVLYNEQSRPEQTRSYGQLQEMLAMTLTPEFVLCLERANPDIKDHFEQLILNWRRETNSGKGIHLVQQPQQQNVYPFQLTEVK